MRHYRGFFVDELTANLSMLPFPFRRLPAEIRREIYKICLVDVDDIVIQFDDQRTFESKGYKKTGFVHLKRRVATIERRASFTRNLLPYLNLNILLTDRTMYKEAAPVLYGLNQFQFYGYDKWESLFHFSHCLSSFSKTSLQILVFDFPPIERSSAETSKFHKSAEWDLSVLRGFPNLRTVRLNLSEDLLSRDLDLLRDFHQRLGQSKVVFDVVNLYEPKDQLYENTVRISSDVLEQFSKWGWKVAGDATMVGKDHRFNDEKVWLDWLGKESRRAQILRAAQIGCGYGLWPQREIRVY